MYSASTSLTRAVAIVAALLLLTACAGTGTRPGPAVTTTSDAARPAVQRNSKAHRLPLHEHAAITAADQVGTPYRYGGADEDGFDCSGLVYFAYQQAGKNIPRTTRSLWKTLDRVARSELRAGDVLFFRIEGKVSHVGMYLGSRRFVHAPQSGRQVSVAKLDAPFYRQAFIGAGRP